MHPAAYVRTNSRDRRIRFARIRRTPHTMLPFRAAIKGILCDIEIIVMYLSKYIYSNGLANSICGTFLY